LKADHLNPRQVPCPLQREQELFDLVGLNHVSG
jgi:hypothetical protein